MIAIMGGAYPNSTSLGTFNFNCGRVESSPDDNDDSDFADDDENGVRRIYQWRIYLSETWILPVI